MKPSKITASVGMVVAVSSNHCEGTHPGKVVGLTRDAGEKYPQRVTVEIAVNPEQCKGSRGLYDTLHQRGAGGFVVEMPFVDPLAPEERKTALVLEPFIAEVREVRGPAKALPKE